MTGPLCTSGDLESDSRRHVNPQSAIQLFVKCSSEKGTGISGEGSANGVVGRSTADDGVRGEARASKKSGVFGINNDNTGDQSFGVSGTTFSSNGFSFGVFGFAVDAGGVGGNSTRGNGVNGHSSINDGVRGDSDSAGKSGVFGFNTTGT